MVIKEYIKGKQLTELEKLKSNIEKDVEFFKFDYSFKYDVGYRVSLEITPVRRVLKEKEKISKDMISIQEYLLEREISFSFTSWGDFIKLSIRDD